jgi:hypothetical protein
MADEQDIALPLLWLDVDDAEISFVNQLVVQHHENDFILTFGHVAPPMLVGTPEENRRRAENIPYVPVKTVKRVGMTPDRMEQFIAVMVDNYRRWSERQGRRWSP